MEWLFLTCHNSWVAFRLVSGGPNTKPFLAYSPVFTIQDSSEPFRALLGAVLSVKTGVSVQESAYHPYTDLGIIDEEVDDGPLPEDDIDDGSGPYHNHSRTSVSPSVPMTRSHINMQSTAGLMVRSLPRLFFLVCS